jgi:hypothetical protein
MDNLSKKLASNDKMLKTISNKVEIFSSPIKNKHSFNKMLKSQISQLASFVPAANPGKIRGQPEELESANLVDIYFVDLCSTKTEEGPIWTNWACPPKEEIQEGPSSPSLLEPIPSRMHFVTLGLAST